MVQFIDFRKMLVSVNTMLNTFYATELMVHLAKNVEDAFSVRKDPKTPLLGQRPTGPAANIPKAVVIIDDLATSLATLKEAAKVLKSAGAKKVLGVTFAREV